MNWQWYPKILLNFFSCLNLLFISETVGYNGAWQPSTFRAKSPSWLCLLPHPPSLILGELVWAWAGLPKALKFWDPGTEPEPEPCLWENISPDLPLLFFLFASEHDPRLQLQRRLQVWWWYYSILTETVWRHATSVQKTKKTHTDASLCGCDLGERGWTLTERRSVLMFPEQKRILKSL